MTFHLLQIFVMQRLHDENLQQMKRRRRANQCGLALLAMAALTLLPGVDSLVSGLPVASLLLGLGAVYLLCFKR